MNKETLSATPENEPTDNQWEDLEIPKNMEDMPLRIDLNSEEFQSKFAGAEIMAKRGTVSAEQITAEGLENGSYNDVYFDDADGKYKMNTYVMEGDGEERHRRLENTHDVEPGMWITTNPKQQESDYPNSYPIEDKKFHKLYEASDEEGVYKAKGLAKLIPNETGREVEIELPESWGGGLMGGDKNCFFRQPCDIDGNPTGRPSIIAADAVEVTYGPLAEVRPDLVDSQDESNKDVWSKEMTKEEFVGEFSRFASPTVKRFSQCNGRKAIHQAWGEYDASTATPELSDDITSVVWSELDQTEPAYDEIDIQGFARALYMDRNSIANRASRFLSEVYGRPIRTLKDGQAALDRINNLEGTTPYGTEKTEYDSMHERKIIDWKNADNLTPDDIRRFTYRYGNPISFRGYALDLIQGLQEAGNPEEKLDEYRNAARDLEKNLYGEEEQRKADELMEATYLVYDAAVNKGLFGHPNAAIVQPGTYDGGYYEIKNGKPGRYGGAACNYVFEFGSDFRLRNE
ncbi:hypothetical protein IJH01_03530 [Candidatus Saccharibacteria bacterium]|nr:hypothetical protein [Candidatus Saccharibacteria bacterium]